MLAAITLLAAACASIGNPSGGPRDEEPPRFVKSSPEPDAVNVSSRKMQLEFDEIVNVRDAFSNVTVSPPSRRPPKVQAAGRRVNIEFNDSLLPNTTYTVDFGNAIEDNNESNRLENFAYSFSTGPQLDTLRISGMVLDALALEPQKGMTVGVHSVLADSAFRKIPFEKIARTDDRGRFTIRGLGPGTYRVFALADADADWRYSSAEEAMAFYDVAVSPSVDFTVVSDSVYDIRNQRLDTVVERRRTVFLPNDLLLRSSVSDVRPQFIVSGERVDSTRLDLIFNARQKRLPEISVVGAPDMRGWYDLERSEGNDSIFCWLRPRSLIAVDTLRISVAYERADSLGRPETVADTLRMITRRQHQPKISAKKKKTENLPAPSLAMKVISPASQDVHLPLLLEFDTPLAAFDSMAVHLFRKTDTIWTEVRRRPRIARPDTLTLRRLAISYPWEFGAEYRLTIDSLAATGIYGLQSVPLSREFNVKREEDYCSLRLNISGIPDSIPQFVEILSTSDNPVRRQKVENGSVLFRWLTPGKYYARIYEDFNGNGRFDPADYDSLRQPDMAYYYPKAINIKKNWDKEENWDVFATAIDLQKPAAIKKNKPETSGKRRSAPEEELPEEEDDGVYDPDYNPFDPNSGRKGRNRGGRQGF